MELEISTNINTQNLPMVTMPDARILQYLGEEGMRKMISDFYDLLVKSDIKHLFPIHKEAIDLAKKHSADFMIQICGGKEYYKESRGNPMLRKRHKPFKITKNARITWLTCYREVLLKQNLPQDIVESFWKYLDDFSIWMVNTSDS